MSEPNSADLKAILAELRDTNKDKRRTAVMKLGMFGGNDAVRALIQTLENEFEDLIVRGRAAMMLGKLGDKTAVAPLMRALDAPGYQTPLYAAEALGRLGDARAIPPLLYIAENGRDRLQETALTALSKLGYEGDDNENDEATSEPDREVEPQI